MQRKIEISYRPHLISLQFSVQIVFEFDQIDLAFMVIYLVTFHRTKRALGLAQDYEFTRFHSLYYST